MRADWQNYFVKMPDGEVVALVWKVGSRSIRNDAGRRSKCDYNGDAVMYCRDPLERLVSSWSFISSGKFTLLNYLPEDASTILITPGISFQDWVELALQHLNAHWMRVSDMHPRWEEYTLRRLTDYTGTLFHKGTYEKPWQIHYTPELEAKAREYYAEDLMIWKKCTDGSRP